MRKQRSHHELIAYAKSLGLYIETLRYRNEVLRTDVIEHIFWSRTGPGQTYYRHGDIIARFTMIYDPDYSDYWDACASLENTLRQFESWR